MCILTWISFRILYISAQCKRTLATHWNEHGRIETMDFALDLVELRSIHFCRYFELLLCEKYISI